MDVSEIIANIRGAAGNDRYVTLTSHHLVSSRGLESKAAQPAVIISSRMPKLKPNPVHPKPRTTFPSVCKHCAFGTDGAATLRVDQPMTLQME